MNAPTSILADDPFATEVANALGLSGATTREELLAACREWNRIVGAAVAAVRQMEAQLNAARGLGRVVIVDVSATRPLIEPN